MWSAFSFGVLEFLGHQPYFAGSKGVICVAVCTSVTVGVEDIVQIHTPGDE